MGCPAPDPDSLSLPQGTVQYGPATRLLTFDRWVCWKGRVGENTSLTQRGFKITQPKMPYQQDEVVRNGRLAATGRQCEAPPIASSRVALRQAGRGSDGSGLPIATARRTTLPMASLRSCAAQAPGPERGGTVISLCVPGLLGASADDGLVPVAAARRFQPRIVGRTRASDLDGRPVQAIVPGPASGLDGLELRHRASGAVRTRVEVVDWTGSDPSTARRATLIARLPPEARVVVERGRIAVRAGTRLVATAALRTVATPEDT